MNKIDTRADEFNRVAQEWNWGEVADLVQLCKDAGFFGGDFQDRALYKAMAVEVRKLLKSQKDSTGWPIWASVVMKDETGRPRRVYKQETLFDLDDYRQVVRYHHGRGLHHFHMERGYRKRAKQKFGKQLNLNFPSDPSDNGGSTDDRPR